MLKKYQHHIPYSFAYILVCVDDKFSEPIAVYRGKNAAYKFIEAILEKVMKKHFNKNLIMLEEEGQQFQLRNICSICEKRIDDDNVRDHCHITGKFRGAAHWSCKYLTEEFGSKNVKHLYQKGTYPYEYMDSFKRFGEEKLPDKNVFTALQKMEQVVIMIAN